MVQERYLVDVDLRPVPDERAEKGRQARLRAAKAAPRAMGGLKVERAEQIWPKTLWGISGGAVIDAAACRLFATDRYPRSAEGERRRSD